MANVKKGQLVTSGKWWKHLRRMKRQFWKRQRRAERCEATDTSAWWRHCLRRRD